MSQIDYEALKIVEDQLDHGEPLTHAMVGSVFGSEYWMLTVETLLDAQDAARAIQGSINRLRGASGGNADFDAIDEEEDLVDD
jgi:hypothetical protein